MNALSLSPSPSPSPSPCLCPSLCVASINYYLFKLTFVFHCISLCIVWSVTYLFHIKNNFSNRYLPNLSSEHMQREIASVIGSERCPNMEDRKSLPFTDAVIHEVQRLLDIVPMNGPHYAVQHISFRGYEIPKVVIHSQQHTQSKCWCLLHNLVFLMVSPVNRAPWSFPCCTLFWEKRNTGQPPGRSIPSTSWTWMATSRRTLHFFHSQQVTSTDI